MLYTGFAIMRFEYTAKERKDLEIFIHIYPTLLQRKLLKVNNFELIFWDLILHFLTSILIPGSIKCASKKVGKKRKNRYFKHRFCNFLKLWENIKGSTFFGMEQ